MKERFSSVFFLRSYVAIAAGILIIALALDSLLVWLIPAQNTEAAQRYAPDFALVELQLQGQNDAESDTGTTGRFRALEPQLEQALGLPLTLYSQDDFAGQDAFLTALLTGAVVSGFDSQGQEILYRLLGDSSQVLALGPLPEPTTSEDSIETIVIISYYVLVAILLFLWVRPFYRDLSALRHAASRFGRDDFSSRVEVDSRSSILPVAQSFNRMAERIQYLVTAHRDLTNAVSHELRTPLARFKFSMEILDKTDDVQKKSHYLNAMKADVQELEELIDEMLSYARLSEENLHFSQSSIHLEAWLNRQMDLYAASPIRVRYRVELDGENDKYTGDADFTADFNAELMARAVNNILRNSLRYAATSVTVMATLSQHSVIIRISDDGPGIPSDKHQLVFEPFSRLDTSRDKQSGGYGLGLAIARRILQRHGGDIIVENNIPHGACFVLQWPRRH
ncbi:MAG: ATP-binding protein [Gammaproteobacteria bacterium]|nr:ATP-binding protein [Gammaproteobacteria bacterium]MDP2349081.1 ATP-binding protein [Gammaproteobacteria bacterium]